MGLHMGFVSGAGCAGQLLLEALGVPGPESSHLRGDGPFSLVFLEFLQENGCTKAPFTSPEDVFCLCNHCTQGWCCQEVQSLWDHNPMNIL